MIPTRSDLKTCKGCLAELPRTNFYAHPRMADGLLSFCKPCVRVRVTKHRDANVERIRASDRARSKGRRKPVVDPVKLRANRAAQQAIKTGRLVSGPCEVCGHEKTDAHHDDYSKPVDVRWLCRKHHRMHHAAVARGEVVRHAF